MLQTLIKTAGGGEHSVLIPELPEVIWSAIILAILFTLVLKFLYPKYIALVDERAEKIKDGLEKAENAKKELAKADRDVQAQLVLAKEEANRIKAEAQESAKQIIAQAKAQATVEADRIATNAARQIEASRQAAQISLRTEVGILAAELAEKIVGEQLKDTELSARVVDRFLDQLEAEPEKESVTE